MNRLQLCVLLLASVSLFASHMRGEEKNLGSPYYPLKIGTQWQYQIGSIQVTMRVAKHEKVGDVLCGLIETSVEGKVVASEHISVGSDGVYRHTFNGQRSSEPLCILKLPAKPGQTWKFDAKIANETVKGASVSGEEEIACPAGQFKTVTADTECQLNGIDAKMQYWFAPGVGVVRQKLNIGGREIVSELTKFEAGK